MNCKNGKFTLLRILLEVLILVSFAVFFLTGCGAGAAPSDVEGAAQDGTGGGKSGPSGPRLTAVFGSLQPPFRPVDTVKAGPGGLLYPAWYQKAEGEGFTRLVLWDVGGGTDPVPLWSGADTGETMIAWFQGKTGEAYWLGIPAGGGSYELRVFDGEGRLLRVLDVTAALETAPDAGSITGGIAYEDGSVCLFSERNLYILTPEGKLDGSFPVIGNELGGGGSSLAGNGSSLGGSSPSGGGNLLAGGDGQLYLTETSGVEGQGAAIYLLDRENAFRKVPVPVILPGDESYVRSGAAEEAGGAAGSEESGSHAGRAEEAGGAAGSEESGSHAGRAEEAGGAAGSEESGSHAGRAEEAGGAEPAEEGGVRDDMSEEAGGTDRLPRDSWADCRPVGSAVSGLLFAGSYSLYEWDGSTGRITRLLDWSDPYINIIGADVLYAWETGPDVYLALTYNLARDKYEYALIERREIPSETEEILLGTSWPCSEEMRRMTAMFNRSGMKYKVRPVFYEDNGGRSPQERLNMELLSGEGPDLLDYELLPTEALADKKLLADLSSRLGELEERTGEKLLDSIRRAGETGGGYCIVIPEFLLNVSAVRSDYFGDAAGVSLRALCGLQRDIGAPLLDNTSYVGDLVYCLGYSMELFVDPEAGTCSFGDKEFTDFLIWLKESQKAKPDGAGEGNVIVLTDPIGKLLRGENLIYADYPIMDYEQQYLPLREQLGGRVSFIGRPTADGSLRTRLQPMAGFGINAGSDRKEGAWAFLEYLLSARYQREETMALPVLQSFHEEEGEEFRALLEAADYGNYVLSDPGYEKIYRIIVEEVSAYMESDKTEEETAQIIQKRAGLLLAERR